MDLRGKKLLVLGGTSSSCEIIKQAKKQGVYVIVTDYLEESPGKKIADKSFMISTTDVEAIVNLIKKERIDGVLTGFIEWMLPYYQQICERAGVFCYITKEQLYITSNKTRFKELCKNFNVPVVEEYHLKQFDSVEKSNTIEFPVIIKPVDSEGGRGVYICDTKETLNVNYKKSLNLSPSRKVIIERYMKGKEVAIFYIIKDGEIYLNAMADRYTRCFDKSYMPLPVAYIFPSRHLMLYKKILNNKVIEMFKSIGLQNGMLFIQSFVENGKFIFYEMGYRLTPTMEYKFLEKINKLNPMEMMINYALTGKMDESDIQDRINPSFNEIACNITFSAKPGRVGKILGLHDVSLFPEVIDVVATYSKGDIIPETAIGTLKQVIIRVFVIAKDKKELVSIIEKIIEKIRVYSEDGENMLLDVFDTKELAD